MKLKGIITQDTFKPRNMYSSAKRTTWLALKSSPVNVLLLTIPFALAAPHVNWPSLAVFILNFVAIVPLAAILAFATEELAEHVGESLGGLLNASFGNAVELIVAVIALKQNQIRVVQTSMLGSILSNSLLVLGCCFIAGGYNRFTQNFNHTVAQTLGSLMILSCSSLMIPAAFHASLSATLNANEKDPISPVNPGNRILKLSRGTSILLLLMYIFYLFFQMKTHKKMFEVDEKPQDVIEEDNAIEKTETKQGNILPPKFQNKDISSDSSQLVLSENNTIDATAALGSGSGPGPNLVNEHANNRNSLEILTHGSPDVNNQLSSTETKQRTGKTKGTLISVAASITEQHLSLVGSLAVLTVVTVIVAFCADYMVDSIDDLVEQSGMSKTFVGFVLIPIVGNAAEHVTSVVVAMKDKMDLSIGVAIGSSTQIALFVTPLMVLIGWWIDKPMSLLFTTFETCVMFISVFICNSLINDGQSTYLEGIMLLMAYVIIAVAFFFFPDSASGLS